MSYLVLARKYRPRSFEELVGQEHVVQALANALTQQRLHHAYLFTGTRGVGKTTVSRILAKSLNCTGAGGTGGITAHPCGVCPACRDIDTGRFVDYVELDAASNRGVEEIQQLLEQSVYKPVVGRFKVYMIDEVHMLSTHAFNAMLKTLEEPPEYLKFVLATTDPQKVPPTVLSRCLQFNLRPMAPQTVHEHLTAVLAEEHIEADGGSLRLLSRAARGSMRDALSLTDQAIAYGSGRLEEPVVRQMLGAVDRTHAVRILDALAASKGSQLVAAVDGLRALGLSATGTLEEMAALLQQMAVVQAVPSSADDADPDIAEVLRLSGLFDADEIQLIYSISLHGRAELSLAPDEYSGLVMVLLRMLAFRPSSAERTADSGDSPASAHGAAGSREAAPGRVAAAAAPAASSAPAGAPRASTAPLARNPGMAAAVSPVPSQHAAERSATVARGRPSADGAPAVRPVAQREGKGVVDEQPFIPNGTVGGRVASETAGGRVTGPKETQRASSATPNRSFPPPEPSGRPVPPDVPARPPAVTTGAAGASSPRPRQSSMPEPPAWLDDVPPYSDSSGSGSSSPDFEEADLMDTGASPASSQSDSRPSGASKAPVVAGFERTELGDRWAALVKQMTDAGSIMAMVRELALQAQCMSIEHDAEAGHETWLIRVERETLRGSVSCERLQAAMAQVLGRAVRLQTEAGATGDTPARRDAHAKAARQREAEEIIESDPLVMSLMQQYKSARIVPGSVKPV